ncbi:helix-turn-helix transcriptional regulator [Gordonia sp. TBRC 11910]|uniref:Helix-turn-helix transcriptional regulator n=1 Tax=Gordonia asplenii TaxID=2725283 RepID=A0A848KUY5_9ACTN|nr:helix-turn-helix transcriptional regulator [Gordonia asplenii]NMO02350.1 helix-turn-helix transcriptional regulator [Gordonia asplenii]
MPERVRGSLQWDTYADAFGVRLRQLRKGRGLTQLDLSLKAGLSLNTVSNAERATSNRPPYISDPGLSTIYRLAKALDVQPMYLLPDVDQTLDSVCTEVIYRSRVEQQVAAVLAGDGTTDSGKF